MFGVGVGRSYSIGDLLLFWCLFRAVSSVYNVVYVLLFEYVCCYVVVVVVVVVVAVAVALDVVVVRFSCIVVLSLLVLLLLMMLSIDH